MSRPRLAILAPLKEWGGIERKFLILCREFVARGIDVEFILTRGGKIPYPDQFPKEVRIIDLKSRGKVDAVPRLIKHLRNSRPAALLTAKDHAAKVGVVAKVLGRLDVRVVVKVTNTLSKTLRRAGKRRSARWLYRGADLIIAISDGVKRDLVDNFGMRKEKIRVIYNPMVTPDMTGRSKECVNHPWFEDGAPPVVIGAGRLTPQKDFMTLLEAFAVLRRDRDCHLIILGEGPEREKLEMRAHALGIADDVLLQGYVADPLPWMASADVFVLSSRYEGLGNVLVEAMAVGTPVVSTACPNGPAEILENGRYGPLVPVGDPQALAQGVRQCLDHPEEPQVLRHGVSRFESGRIAEEYLEALGLEAEEAARVR